jgi:N5-(cytidine 5'-diphosphoramidyl)-L-glutamine hydrolase
MSFLLGVTQRVDNNNTYGERRDALDQAWARFLQAAGYGIMPIPNGHPNIEQLVSRVNLDGIVLTGGNTIAWSSNGSSYVSGAASSDLAPERDETELALLKISVNRKWPVLGFCRGMQMINLYHGGRLSPVERHVGEEHDLVKEEKTRHSLLCSLLPGSSNSYHNYGIAEGDLAEPLAPLATAPDGTVEAFTHPKSRHVGVMWHPERYEKPREADLALMRYIFS